jgi:hypothetical protein
MIRKQDKALAAGCLLLAIIPTTLSIYSLRPVVAALGWSLLCTATGYIALTFLPQSKWPWPFALATGIGLLSFLFFFAALLGCYRPWLIVVLLIALLIVGVSRFSSFKNIVPFGLKLNLFAAALLLGAGAVLPVALLPPQSFDALVYHLALPEMYLNSGYFTDLPENIYSHFPLGLEWHYGFLIHLGGARAPALFHLIIGCALLIGLMSLPSIEKKALLPATLALAASTAFWMQCAVPNVDAAPALFVVVAVYLILLDDGNEKLRFLLAGLMAGFSLACKLSSVNFVVLPLIILAVMDAPSLRAAGRRIMLMLPAILIPILPYLVRNMILEGNPVFPLLCNLFGSHTWSDEQVGMFDKYIMNRAGLAGLWHALLPAGFSKGENLRHSIGIVLLSPLCLLCLREKRGRALLVASLAGLASFVLASRGEMRFLLPLMPLMATTFAFAMQGNRWCTVRKAMTIILFAFIIINIRPLATPLFNTNMRNYILGEIDETTFYHKSGLTNFLTLYALNGMPDIERVMMVGEMRRFGVRHPSTAPTVFDSHPMARQWDNSKDGAQLAAWLISQGYTHIYMNRRELDRLRHAFEPLGWTDAKKLEAAMTGLNASSCLELTNIHNIPTGKYLFKIKQGTAGQSRKAK